MRQGRRQRNEKERAAHALPFFFPLRRGCRRRSFFFIACSLSQFSLSIIHPIKLTIRDASY